MESAQAPQSQSQSNSNSSTPPTSHFGMWDSFQCVLMFISLYVMATSIGLILNYFVDKWIPAFNAINYYGGANDYTTRLFAGYSAALIVSFPFFAYFFLETTRRQKKFPYLSNLRTRKILIYLTLIGTFIIMLGSLIATVYQLMLGNMSLNFILHFAVTIAITGIIFGYFLHDVRQDRKVPHA